MMQGIIDFLSRPVSIPQTIPFGCLIALFLFLMFLWFLWLFSLSPLYTPEERLDRIEEQMDKTHGPAWWVLNELERKRKENK